VSARAARAAAEGDRPVLSHTPPGSGCRRPVGVLVAVLLAAWLAGPAGCSHQHPEVPAEALRLQVLAPPGAELPTLPSVAEKAAEPDKTSPGDEKPDRKAPAGPEEAGSSRQTGPSPPARSQDKETASAEETPPAETPPAGSTRP